MEGRYARQLQLPQIGPEGQRRLSQSTVLLVGLGGLGCASAPYLALAGVGCLRLVDPDEVRLPDLGRQILYTEGNIGRRKVEAAAERLSLMNPEVRVEQHVASFDGETAARLTEGVDLILDGTDQLAPRLLINRAFVHRGIPAVFAGAAGFNGYVMTCAGESPCFECVWTEPQHLSCNEVGVIGPLVGQVGAAQASEAIILLATARAPLVGRLLLIDALKGNRTLDVRRRSGCLPCASRSGTRIEA